ncbi:Uncharacterised protein [Streptococcus pneumoniae]|nr:Uncharacterised protein [Streptococcus pneumoniae]
MKIKEHKQYSMKIKDKLGSAAGCSKQCFEVADGS